MTIKRINASRMAPRAWYPSPPPSTKLTFLSSLMGMKVIVDVAGR